MSKFYNCNDCIHWHCQKCVGCMEIYPPKHFKSKVVFKAEFLDMQGKLKQALIFLKSQYKAIEQEFEKDGYCRLIVNRESNEKLKLLIKSLEEKEVSP